MIRLWLLVFLAFAPALYAEPVKVTSGEHDGFTRLVFDYGHSVNWTVGRSEDGYELVIKGETPTYDLQQAFALIGKSRLAAVWAAPETGNLHVGMACACHAIPFEFRPGIVVMDLKDGPPPLGSAFELTLDGGDALPLKPATTPRPRPRQPQTASPYVWTEVALADLQQKTIAPLETPASTMPQFPEILPPDPSLQPLRDTLLRQMSRGASQGLVDLARPNAETPQISGATFPSAQIRIGDSPGSVNKRDTSVLGTLGANGVNCISQGLLAVQDWGDEDAPFITQLSDMKSELSGEFDLANPETVVRAARFLLFAGFGAEARQTLDGFGIENESTKVAKSLAYLVDGARDPDRTFEGQAACDGPAALWAVLADASLDKGTPVNTGAVRLAFSALPRHLRRLLGPPLAEKFLALQDETTARALADAVNRSPGDNAGEVELMAAELDLHEGEAARAEKTATAVVAEGGPSQAGALIALTEARIAQSLPVSAEVALALHSHLAALSGTELEPRLKDASILADAASGNFLGAFAGLKTHPNREADVWRIMVALAPDNDFLSFAVLETDEKKPDVSEETAAAIAGRLIGLGLFVPAKPWLAGIKSPDPVLVAQVALGARDGREALTVLAGDDSEVARVIKVQAFELLGEVTLRAKALSDAGGQEAASAAWARAGDWGKLAKTGSEEWKALAQRVVVDGDLPVGAEVAAGPLARGQDLIAAGAATRAEIDKLLATVPHIQP